MAKLSPYVEKQGWIEKFNLDDLGKRGYKAKIRALVKALNLAAKEATIAIEQAAWATERLGTLGTIAVLLYKNRAHGYSEQCVCEDCTTIRQGFEQALANGFIDEEETKAIIIKPGG